MVLYGNSLLQLLDAFDFAPQLRLAHKNHIDKKPIIELKIEQKPYLFKGRLAEHLGLVHNPKRLLIGLVKNQVTRLVNISSIKTVFVKNQSILKRQ